MGNTIYQILKNGEPTGGYYQRERAAEAHIEERNLWAISRMMYQAHELTGIKRGKGASEFQEYIDKVAKPPYTIKSLYVM